MKKTLRILSLLLALVFLLSLAPLSAFADAEEPIDPAVLAEMERQQREREEEERKRREREEAERLAAEAAAAAAATALASEVTGETDATIIPDNPAGETLPEVQNDEEMVTNSGTIETNNGTVDNNNGTIETNNGEVGTNNNEVTTNEGDGTVETNNGTVETNSGAIETNNGTVETNNGTIDSNEKTGEVENNEGEIGANNGTVETNNGTIDSNEKTGTVENNQNTITNNEGTVKNNGGTVGFNTGKVTNTETGTVEYNAGGKVTGGTVENDGYALKLGGLKKGNDPTVEGAGPNNGSTYYVDKDSEVTITVKDQKGYILSVSGGATVTKKKDGDNWIVTLTNVDNNVQFRFRKPITVEDNPGPTIDDLYMCFIRCVAKAIREAPKNSAVEVDAGYWLSYRTEVFQALAERKDVSLRTTYRRDGKLMRFTIPAGTDVISAVHPEIVVEYPKLAQLLDITPEVLG